MTCSKFNKKRLNIQIKGEPIKQLLYSYCCLGSSITDDGKTKLDIICRIAQGKRTFQNKNHLLMTNGDGLETRKNFLKIYVYTIQI